MTDDDLIESDTFREQCMVYILAAHEEEIARAGIEGHLPYVIFVEPERVLPQVLPRWWIVLAPGWLEMAKAAWRGRVNRPDTAWSPTDKRTVPVIVARV